MKSSTKHRIRRICMCGIPIIVAFVLAFVLRNHIKEIDKTFFEEIVKIVIDLKGTILGFVITVISILVAFNGSNLTEEVKRTGHFKTVLLMYLVACIELFVSIVYCVAIILTGMYCFSVIYFFIVLLLLAAIYIMMCLVCLGLIVYTLFK